MSYIANPGAKNDRTRSSLGSKAKSEKATASRTASAEHSPVDGDLKSLMPDDAADSTPSEPTSPESTDGTPSGTSVFSRRHTTGDPRITVKSASETFRLKAPELREPVSVSAPEQSIVERGYFGAILDKIKEQPTVVKAAGGAALLAAAGAAGTGAVAVLAGTGGNAQDDDVLLAEDDGVARLGDDAYVDAYVVSDVTLGLADGCHDTVRRFSHNLNGGNVVAVEYYVDDEEVEDLLSAVTLKPFTTELAFALFPDLVWKMDSRPGCRFGGGFCGYVDADNKANAFGCLVSYDESTVYVQRVPLV